jgi:HAD superfamily hydrolase (TIGR01509 family)
MENSFPFNPDVSDNSSNYFIEAVIWDMDGVLVDTGSFHYQVWKIVLQDHDIQLNQADFSQTFGMNNDGFLRYFLGERFETLLAHQISQEKEIRLRHMIRGNLKAFPGALSIITDVSRLGIPQALASSAPLANIKAVLAELTLEDKFQAILSAEFMPGKPDPAIFLEAAKMLDVNPANCLVIEDAIPGVKAAKEAGMRCLAVATTNTIQSLSSADRAVTSLDQISLNELLTI